MPLTVNVPVAVIFATLEMFPEKRALPWTARSWEGEVVPMPKNPFESNRAASLRTPLLSTEKARIPLPGSKLLISWLVMAEVVIVLVAPPTWNANRVAVLVAD